MNQTPPRQRRFFILAGEASGDQHGAALMAAMGVQDASCRFAGIGGSHMQTVGMDCLYDAERMSLVGFSEVLRQLPFLWRAMRRILDHILHWKPERVILIDYPGFNLRLAKRLHRLRIPVTYYISPQLWAWKEGRIATIRKYVDQLLVIFPFEVAWYRERGVKVQFVGHPIMEEPEPKIPRDDYLRSLGMDPRLPVLTLFPGSRRHELDRHLQLFYDTARLLQQELPGLQVILGLAQGLAPELVPADIRQDIIVTSTRPRLALRYADTAIIASGTSTLEAAVWGVPMVVVYRMSAFSWWLGRRLVTVPYVGMVNILSGKEVVPEFLQDRAQPGPIARAILRYFQDGTHRQAIRDQLAHLRQSLAAPPEHGALENPDQSTPASQPSQLAARMILTGE